MYKVGFDNEKYLKMQSENIMKRIEMFEGKLYLEFGGKLFDDYHATRVLPGFHPDSKLRLLKTLSDKAEIVIVINAASIDSTKVIGDTGISYDDDVLRLIDVFRDNGLYVGSVVISQYMGQTSADTFKAFLERSGIKVYVTHYISDDVYPNNIQLILSDEGYGNNDYIETTRPLIVVTAPGPGSGKMATCLSQLYQENKRGIRAGYAKFETFPAWNLPLSSRIHMAYEAATADLNDVNMIDHFHLDAYGISAVNYNRDIEAFPLLNAMFTRIWGESPYKSPTDMGVNMVGNCIIDEDACNNAASQEIIRRYYNSLCDYANGRVTKAVVSKIELLMNTAGLSVSDRPTVGAALEKAELTGSPATAIQLADGTILTGKTSDLLSAPSAALLNTLKYLAEIDDTKHLLSPEVIGPVQQVKVEFLGNTSPQLNVDEVLIALSACTPDDKIAASAFAQLPRLVKAEVHSTVLLPQVDLNVFRQLGMNVTCEPVYKDKRLFRDK